MRGTKRASSKQNRRKGTLRFKVAAVVVFVLGIGAGVYLTLNSSLFALREVVFYGNRHLSDTELARLGKIRRNSNLVRVSSREVAERLSSSPWIKAVSVRKEYPGKLLAKVEEAEPTALLQGRAGLFLMDDGGNVLEKLRGESVPFLPVIVAKGRGRNPQSFSEALSLARAVKESGLATEKSRIEITGVEDKPEALAMTVDGLVVRIGQGHYEKKLSKLFELADEIRRRWEKTEYVDLRFADRVVVKPMVTGR
jgi:cell division protein FtsQ